MIFMFSTATIGVAIKAEEGPMKELDTTQSEIIDLGSASEETKGDALFDIDVSGGRLSYATGMADD